MTNTVTLIGFWCAIAMFAFGSAAVVRNTRRWRHNSNVAPFNSFAVLVLIPIAAVITVAVTAKIGSTAGANPLTDAQDVLDSSAMLGGAIGAVLAWCYALTSVLIASTRRSREHHQSGR